MERCPDRPLAFVLFGESVHLDFPLATPLPAAAPPCSLEIRLSEADPSAKDWLPVYRSERGTGFTLSGDSRHAVLDFRSLARFEISPPLISCVPASPISDVRLMEIALLGKVSALWLEARGRPAIHASAAIVGGGAVGFIGNKRAGKTTLAAELMLAGFPLLTDDLLALDEDNGFRARPSYPQLKMQPQELTRLGDGVPGLARVIHPRLDKLAIDPRALPGGGFCSTPRPLRSLYLLARDDSSTSGRVHVEPLSPESALIELIRFSFAPQTIRALGLDGFRLRILARLVRHIPVRRISYPSGREHLSRVIDRITRDSG